jgi:iron complex outermembrane recepter protein
MRFLLLILAISIASSGWAQYQLKGKVMSANNEALQGASVRIAGTSYGVVTDKDGEFMFVNLRSGQLKLLVTYIGHKSHTEKIDLNENTNVEITLEEELVLTEDVFVYATRVGKNDPFASTSVSKSELESRNMGQDIPYLLSSTPSFVATSDAGAGVGYTGFRIRGTDANRINVTINGVPLNDAESHGVFWVNMPDFSTSVDNVQVQRGVGTSTHGAGAFGATVNMQTNTLKQMPYAEYNGTAGSFSTFKNSVSLGTGLMGNGFSFDARLSNISSDGFIDRSFSKLKSYFVSGGYYMGSTIVKANIFSGAEKTYQAWNGVPSVRLNNDLEGMQRYADHWLITEKQTEEMIASNSRTYNIYTYENETDNYQQDHYQLLVSHRFSTRISMSMAGHYTRGLGYFEQFKPDQKLSNYGFGPVQVGDTAISRTDIIRRKWLDNHFGGTTFSVHYLKNRSEVTLGGGWNRYIGDHFGDMVWMAHAGDVEKGDEWYRNRGVKSDFNTYLKINHALTNTLNLYADVQYRNILYSIEGADDDLRDLAQNHDYDFLNPKLGINYQPNNRSKAYLSWAVAHREPSRSNLTDADPNGPIPTFEKLNDFEAGYQYQSSILGAGANLYYMLYTDQLVLTGQINDVGSAIMVNVDDSYRAGIELMANIKLGKLLQWEANATFSRNQINNFTEYVDNWDTGGQESFELGATTIAFSPSVVANSIVKLQPLRQLSLSLQSQYVGKQYIDNSGSEDRMLDAYFVNNLLVDYTFYPSFAKEFKFTLMVNNLLNQSYETNAWVYSYILGGERYKIDGYFPQAGTNFLAGIAIKF